MSLAHAPASGLPAHLLPIGAIIAWAGNPASVPPGWLVCDGTAKSRSTYARLYAAVTTTYGSGDGSTTFNLPNLSSKHAYGGNATGATGGATTHDHPFTSTVAIANVASGDHNHNYNSAGGFQDTGIGSLSHAHNGSASFASGNSASNAAKATGNGVSLQGSAHGHPNTSIGTGVTGTFQHSHTASAQSYANSGNHEEGHSPSASIASYVNQVTYQAASSSMATASSLAPSMQVRAIIRAT